MKLSRQETLIVGLFAPIICIGISVMIGLVYVATRTPFAAPVMVQTATAIIDTSTPSSSGRIAFASDRYGNFEIYVMNADGSNVSRLTNNLSDDASPTWSPDGNHIAFASNEIPASGIYMVNVDDAETATSLYISTDLPSRYGNAVWSPNGERIAFVKTSIELSPENAINEILTVNVIGLETRRLIDCRQQVEGCGGLSWSPDSNNIVFAGGYCIPWPGNPYGCDLKTGIFRMNADGSGTTLLLSEGAWSPAWSPDGSRIAFVSSAATTGSSEVYVMNADGSGITRLTNNLAEDRSPAWSPDGRYIAFSSNLDGNFDVYIMDSDGSNQINVTNDSLGWNLTPAWSPKP